MVKKFNTVIRIASLAVGMIFLSAPALAQARPAAGNSSGAQVQVSPVQYSQASFNVTTTVSTANVSRGNAYLNGKLEVQFMMPQGMPMNQLHGCFWGDMAWSEWTTSSGGFVTAPPGHHGWTHACHVKRSHAHPTGLVQIGGCTYHLGQKVCSWRCFNNVGLMGEKPIAPMVYAIIVMRHGFVFQANAYSKAIAKLFGSALAEVQTANCTAESTFFAWGYGYAQASATASARSRSQAITKAQAQSVTEVNQQKGSAFSQAESTASVGINGQATALCSGTPTPTSQSIVITQMTQLNQVPAGFSSGPFNFTVNASGPGGEVTIDPGNGKVSDCSGGAQQSGMTITGLSTGDNPECVEFWPPSNDASQPTTETVTITATLGTASDQKIETFSITYPQRPGSQFNGRRML